nr:hypothetical protein [Schwartzia sp. (in: firmicutes)]
LDIDSNSLSDVKYNKDENKLNAGTYKTDFTNPKITSKNNNYKIVTTDNLNVNPLKIDIEYTVSNKRKAYSDENPTMTGSDVTVKAGFVNGDSFDTSYSFNEIEENPEIGIYEGILDITKTVEDWQKAVGENYVVGKVIAHKGTLTVYDPDAVVPPGPGSTLALPGVVPVSEDSAVVDGQGLDMPKEATAPRPINDESDTHPNVSFRPADEAEEQSDAKNDAIWKEVASDNSDENEEDGGEIERERRGSLRFLTIEDTGINVKPAVPSANIITVHASSRSDGGSTVVLESLRDEVRVLGTEPLLKGTTMDTLKDSAVIRYGAKRNKFKPIIEMSPAELSELLSTAFAEGEAAVVLSK